MDAYLTGYRPEASLGCWVASSSGLNALASAFALSPEWLLALRIATGIDLQAAVGVLLVVVSEMFPSARRGRFFTMVTFMGFAAVPITSFTALAIVPPV